METQPVAADPDAARRARRAEIRREATMMVLYVSVVEIAELAALPEAHSPGGIVTGPVGGQLLAILWGTAIGLALAHWFAFGVAGRAARGFRPSRTEVHVGFAQLGGAAIVAALSSLPVLALSDVRAQETTGDVPAVIIGVVGYLLARRAGGSRGRAALFGGIAVGLGIGVALAKTALAAH